MIVARLMYTDMPIPRTPVCMPVKLLLMAFALTFFSACQSREQRPAGDANLAPRPQGAANTPGSPPNASQPALGTSDPGGGNGVDGKVLESFAKSLKELRG